MKVIGVILRGPSPLVLDAGTYWELGGLVADGDWLLMQRPIAYRTPAYPWLIGVIRGLSRDPLFVLVCVQGLLWTATIGLTTLIARQLSDRRNITWIVLASAIPMVSSVTYVTTVLTETLFVFLLVLHLWTVARFTRRPAVIGGLLMGATLGLAILTRPVAMLVWVADAIYILTRWYWIPDPLATHLCLRRGKISVGVAVLVAIGCVSPWLARNQAMFGKAMLTEFVGRNIWIVTFQDGSGAGLDLPATDSALTLQQQLGENRWNELQTDDRWRDTWTVSHALTASGMDDPSGDRLMKSIAQDAIAQSPGVFANKTFRRLVNFWRTRATDIPAQVADLEPHENLAGERYAGQEIWGVKVAPVDTALHYRWSNWLTGNTFLMLATAAATMLLIWRRGSRASGLWLAAILGYFATVTAVLEIPAYRYRMIIEPVVVLVIALATAPLLFAPNPADPDDPTAATNPE